MSKRKFFIITYISYFFGICMALGIFYIFYYLLEDTIDKASPLNIALLSISTFSILFVIAFFVWARYTRQGAKYQSMYHDWQEDKLKNQAITEITGTEYYDTLPEYTGVNTFIVDKNDRFPISIGFIFCIFIIIFCIASIFNDIQDNQIEVPILGLCIIAIAVCTVATIKILNKSFRKEITIDAQGVTLKRKIDGKVKTRTLKWEKIKVIGLSVAPDGKRIPWGYLYFTTKDIKHDKVIPQYFEKPYVIIMTYRPKAIHCILQYWDKEIRNLEAMKNWKKYIDKL